MKIEDSYNNKNFVLEENKKLFRKNLDDIELIDVHNILKEKNLLSHKYNGVWEDYQSLVEETINMLCDLVYSEYKKQKYTFAKYPSIYDEYDFRSELDIDTINDGYSFVIDFKGIIDELLFNSPKKTKIQSQDNPVENNTDNVISSFITKAKRINNSKAECLNYEIHSIYNLRFYVKRLLFDRTAYINNKNLETRLWLSNTSGIKGRIKLIEENVYSGQKVFLIPYKENEKIGKSNLPIFLNAEFKVALLTGELIGDIQIKNCPEYSFIFKKSLMNEELRIQEATVTRMLPRRATYQNPGKPLVELNLKFSLVKEIQYDNENFLSPNYCENVICKTINNMQYLAAIDYNRKIDIIEEKVKYIYYLEELFNEENIDTSYYSEIYCSSLSAFDLSRIELSELELKEFWDIYSPLIYSINNKEISTYNSNYTRFYNGNLLCLKYEKYIENKAPNNRSKTIITVYRK